MQNDLHFLAKNKILLFLAAAISAVSCQLFADVEANNSDELYSAFQKGESVALKKGAVYEINKPLRFAKDGQRLYTKDAKRLSDYATLIVTEPEGGQILNGNGKKDILVEKVKLDGNRYGVEPYEGGGPELVWFGGPGAENQKIRNCVLMNSRTWSTLKLHEGGDNCSVENTILFGCGADARGNGRLNNPLDKPFKWGDGISCAARNSVVKNNIIIDPTDVGIVLFCAPGSKVSDNVIASISRESLGGINMVDGLGFYEIDKEKVDKTDKKAMHFYDYGGVVVENNLIDARGARIHIAMPLGATVWVPRDFRVMTFVGAKILNNTLSGEALAYGIVADGIDKFVVKGNKSKGKHSGLADGRWQILCDEPAPFLYNPGFVGTSELQKDFKPQERDLMHLLRCNHGPVQRGGEFKDYRAYSYGVEEGKAAVKTAFIEMLGREATKKETDKYSRIINEHVLPADALRLMLAKMPEFTAKNGELKRDDLHKFRTKKWMDALDKAIGTSDNWKAQDVYEKAFKSLKD